MKPIAESRPRLSHNSTCRLGLTTFLSLKIEFDHPKVDKDEAELAKDVASGVGGQNLSGVNRLLIWEKKKNITTMIMIISLNLYCSSRR